MRYYLKNIAFWGLFLCSSITLSAQKLTTYFDYKIFQVPGTGHLLETYFDTKGYSVEFVPAGDSLQQASIELTIIITKGQGIKDFRKEAVLSPLAPIGTKPDFMSIQQFLLPKGTYTMEVEIRDVNSTDTISAKFEERIDLEFNSDRKGFSDIELLAGFRPADSTSLAIKSGLDLLPYLSNSYETEFNELLFYVELYSMEKVLKLDEPYLLSYFLEDADSETPLASTHIRKRKKATSTLAELGLLDISQVPTGLYNLRIEALDREGALLAFRETPIIRRNDSLVVELEAHEINQTFVGEIDNKDTLVSYIHALRPLSQDKERNFIDRDFEEASLLECKSFFYSFWEARDPFKPDLAWQAYKEKVRMVDERFGTSNRAGYETDMGRVFLIYGAPNSVVTEAQDPEAYPYQIWHYYKAGKFTDRRFVFYDRELLNREYTLLHSDVPGEVRNPRWNILINSRNNPTWNNDQNRGSGRGSDRLQENFSTPY